MATLALTQTPGRAQPVTNHAIFQYAIFYNSLLEFTWCATLTVNGRTHANGDIFIGPAGGGSSLTFNSPVTATGAIYLTNWDGHTAASMGPTMFATNDTAGTPGYVTNVAPLHLPIGTDQSPAAVREIIQMPPPGENTNSYLAQSRYYNKAGVVVLVSNTSITVSLKTSMADTPTNLVELFAPTNMIGTNRYTSTNFPWLTLSSKSLIEFREGQKKVKLTDIDVSVLKNWLPTNAFITSRFTLASGQYPNIFYVADLRDQASTELAAVRLKNGAIIPTNQAPTGPTGWTFSTPNPLYVQSHYNLGPGGVAGTNDTSKAYPASLISDALTVLSTSWNDTTYTNANLNSRPALDTTVNAAVLTGVVYSKPTDWTDTNHFSGGVMNLPRLLENWNGHKLTLNTSMVNLFNSIRATNFFQNPGVYYQAPTRLFSFDNNFTNYAKLPPGTPICGSPPIITAQPRDETVVSGDTTVLTVASTSDDPAVTYQWTFNGTNLPGETNVSLTLTNVQPDQEGDYAAQITSAFGSTVSSNATLTVLSQSYSATLGDFSLSSDGQPQFSVSGVVGSNYAIQASTNLVDWEPLITNASPFIFSDTNATSFPQRFYRAVYQP